MWYDTHARPHAYLFDEVKVAPINPGTIFSKWHIVLTAFPDPAYYVGIISFFMENLFRINKLSIKAIMFREYRICIFI